MIFPDWFWLIFAALIIAGAAIVGAIYYERNETPHDRDDL